MTLANAANSKIDAYLDPGDQLRRGLRPDSGDLASTLSIKRRTALRPRDYPLRHRQLPRQRPAPATNYSWLYVTLPCTWTARPSTAPSSGSHRGGEFGVNAYCTYVSTPAQSTSTSSLPFDGRIKSDRQVCLPAHHPAAVSGRPADHDRQRQCWWSKGTRPGSGECGSPVP